MLVSEQDLGGSVVGDLVGKNVAGWRGGGTMLLHRDNPIAG